MQRYFSDQDSASDPLTPIGRLASQRAAMALMRALRGTLSLAEIHALLCVWRDMGTPLTEIRQNLTAWLADCSEPYLRERLVQAIDLATGFCAIRLSPVAKSGRRHVGIPHVAAYVPRARPGARPHYATSGK
ncbi:hypothetical protein [Chitinimonas lacunae]|uniref:Uncharacterized protein n=1 Tax=Chitinimonas lacunae TaxID=1963018 RepID=A0ABV8MR02_9NEIS